MANVTVHKDGGEKREVVRNEPAPERMMRSLLSWDPFRELSLRWDPFRELASERAIGFTPAFEVKETKDAYQIKADLPGVKESDLDITLTANRLVINGKRDNEKEEKSDNYYVYERNYGSFSRAFTLPVGIDADRVAASMDKGVLTITVAKKPEVQGKKIAVGAESAKRS
ncbi:MAG: Hsp20/alpha crystallin family protein [Polyangiales bacterium]